MKLNRAQWQRSLEKVKYVITFSCLPRKLRPFAQTSFSNYHRCPVSGREVSLPPSQHTEEVSINLGNWYVNQNLRSWRPSCCSLAASMPKSTFAEEFTSVDGAKGASVSSQGTVILSLHCRVAPPTPFRQLPLLPN